MLQSIYYTELDLKDFGFKHLGKNIKISSDVRIYGAENIEIHDNVRIDDFAILSASTGYIILKKNVFIARSCHLSGTYGIIMNDFSSMAANTIIYSASDDYSGKHLTAQVIPKEYTSYVGGKVEIGRHVIIGANCTIIGAANIEEGCSIGSMSLIKGITNAWGIYAGIPAKRIKDRSKDLLALENDYLRSLEGDS
jgi:acetyltransferase-like isoleucine patch superfamily enzyme